MRKALWIALASAFFLAAAAGRAYAVAGPQVAPPPRLAAPASGLPASWIPVSRGPNGGSVWSGRIPNRYVASARPSAIYLPPRFSPSRRYPVLYLLHGLPGSPSSYYDGLHLAQVADSMIAAGRVAPMIVVMPAGANSGSAEWAGQWDAFVANGVVPWVDARLPTVASPAGRVLGGLCAGGYGAMDIGLRHPGLFGALESWEGYFAPVFRDGPFVHAPQSFLNANDPALLVQRQAAALRRARVRFYVSVGGNHAQVLRQWSLDFSSQLGRLGLAHTLWQLPAAERGHFWAATLPSALQFASSAFTRPAA